MTNVVISEQETWKDIPNYEGVYQASSLGRIRSLDKYVKSRWGNYRLIKGRVVRQIGTNRNYLRVDLNDKGKSKLCSVHSLILTAFVGPRPKGYVCMHLNDITTDNKLVNLKWGTQSENVLDSYKKGNTAANNKRPVQATCLKTGAILFFECISRAKKDLGIKSIDRVLTGERRHAKNYHFKYI